MGVQQEPNDRTTTVVDEEEEEKKPRECCKKVLKFSFSHIGLCGMVVAYSVAGGFIFKHLEQTNEKQSCIKARDKYLSSENETVDKLWQISLAHTNDQQPEAEIAFQDILEKFRDNVLDLGYGDTDCDDLGKGTPYQWSFPGALLFSVTVITTIGYGNIAPKTFWGRLVCIAYAVLGIPLMLLCLANIGDVLADVFRFVYTKICCCGCCRRKDKNKVESLDQKGRGSPEAWKEQYNRNQAAGGGGAVDDPDDDDDDEEDEKVSVPLTITMTIIAVYILFGAVIFAQWEGWTTLTASYFCFVTISTIGFGDLVPGSTSFDKSGDEYKMVFVAVYMLFGMAILSMCFSLIQEEIVAKFRWVGEKLGIVEKEQPPEDDEEEDEEEEDKGLDKRNAGPPPEAAATKPKSAGRPSYLQGGKGSYPSSRASSAQGLPTKSGSPPIGHQLPPKKQ